MRSLFARFATRRLILLLSAWAFLLQLHGFAASGQVNTGALRLRTVDSAGVDLAASITISSDGSAYFKEFSTDDRGVLEIKSLPYGVYLVKTAHLGFAPSSATVEISSALPAELKLTVGVNPVRTVVNVNEQATLVDPFGSSSVERIGEREIDDRISSLPGRSIQDLVNSQPGWLYEGNAVLHPRGSEYQTQFVIDGIPLTDNRSPSFGPEVEADDIDSMAIYTAGIPAEYGRKMGGIVELNTRPDTRAGLHGEAILGGGSYDTAQGYGGLQYDRSSNLFGATASGSQTSHYLNPVVPQNYTNRGTAADFSVRLEHDFTHSDTLNLSVRHELSRFEIPNELLQQEAGQLETGGNFETIGTGRYQHIFAANALLSVAAMVRDTANTLDSNDESTPIIAAQRNDFREGYFKAAFSLHHGRQEFKAGVESDSTSLHENFTYDITDPDQFDDDTPPNLVFAASHVNLEEGAFLEDQIRFGNWSISGGLRYDHYQLLLNEDAFSPRISIGRYFPKANLTLHLAYDRIFQTPSFENILISSSPSIDALNSEFLRLPVKPSRGDYYEAGVNQGISSRLILSANVYRRRVSNYADDDQLLNTGVSYPIAFDHAVIYGAESKLELTSLGRLSGYASYSYMVGNVWYPVTGGLFLGDDADNATAQLSGHFPDSQDQRNTFRERLQYRIAPRIWVASGLTYNSGLPFEFGGTQEDAVAQYGTQVTDRVNFDRGRVKPGLSVSASAGLNLYNNEGRKVTLHIDGDNLNNRLNVIDFGGLFSGNAIGPQRSVALRLDTSF